MARFSVEALMDDQLVQELQRKFIFICLCEVRFKTRFTGFIKLGSGLAITGSAVGTS
jgi:hypothetical protein